MKLKDAGTYLKTLFAVGLLVVAEDHFLPSIEKAEFDSVCTGIEGRHVQFGNLTLAVSAAKQKEFNFVAGQKYHLEVKTNYMSEPTVVAAKPVR